MPHAGLLGRGRPTAVGRPRHRTRCRSEHARAVRSRRRPRPRTRSRSAPRHPQPRRRTRPRARTAGRRGPSGGRRTGTRNRQENSVSRLTLSVVIPAFDEEDSIGSCLDLLCAQAADIDEIIVVDNNSRDRTADIVADRAARSPLIRTVTERRQGLVFARNAGMDAARGDLIARIDADTRVGPDWARTVRDFVTRDTDGHWWAVCGRGEAYDLPYGTAAAQAKSRFSPFGRRRAPEVRDVPVLYGSNMILRRATWAAIRDRVSDRRDVFEDVDMGLCVRAAGGRNGFLADLTVGVFPRRMHSPTGEFVRYMVCLPRTLMLHRRFGLALAAAALYVPGVVVLHAARLIVIRAATRAPIPAARGMP
ncbi:glycosyltransferase family 2 protein [Rhodococcus kroppenstedtii]|nr:glycosyltransferase family 2 protein [Rhodococcus kroppenstedtii]